jgi:hypothetical protein
VCNLYVPAKVETLHPDAKEHPDPISERETASLAGVVAPEITYALSHHLDVSVRVCHAPSHPPSAAHRLRAPRPQSPLAGHALDGTLRFGKAVCVAG